MRGYFSSLNSKLKSSVLVIKLVKSKSNFNSFFWIVLGGKSNFALNFVSLGFYKHSGNKKFCFIWMEELINWLYFGAVATYKLKSLLFFINLFKLNNSFLLFFNKSNFFYLDKNWIFFDLFMSKYLEYEEFSSLNSSVSFKDFLCNFL